MAYGTKYRTSYKRRSGGTTTIDILLTGYTGDVIELKPDKIPLEITKTGDINNIYYPTQGTGAVIRVYVEPLTMYTDLFTTNPQQLIVKIYNGVSGSSLVWQGFVSPGIYSEDYSTTQLTPIAIQCQDGMSLLDDLYYLDTDESEYTGFATISEVMGNIFSKLNISFTSIITNNTLKIASATTNPFLYLTVNDENYIDESQVPMTCRQVLNSIFQPLGLVMAFRGETIYLIDPINLHTASNGKDYDTSPAYGANEGSYSIGGYLDISNGDIDYFETGQSLDVIRPFNQIVVKYDPYNFTGIKYNFNDEDNVTIGSSYGCYTDGDISYCLHIDNEMEDWYTNATNKFEGFQLSGETMGQIEYAIRQTTDGSGYFQYVIPYSNIKQDENMKLQLLMDVYTNTKHATNLWSEAEGTLVNEIQIPVYIKVGDQWYGGGNVWQTSQTSTTMTIRSHTSDDELKYSNTNLWFYHYIGFLSDIDTSIVNDTWITGSVLIDMGQSASEDFISGSITVYIPKLMTLSSVTPSAAEASILNLLIKNIEVNVLTTTNIPITNEGVKTNSIIYNYNTIKRSPLEITLTNGCGTYGSSKGAFSTDQQTVAGINITGLARDDTYIDTAKLLAQSLLSQYYTPRLKLSANLDVSSYLLDVEHKLIKDSDYLGSKAFYITSYLYNDRDENMIVEMLEITNTRETI